MVSGFYPIFNQSTCCAASSVFAVVVFIHFYNNCVNETSKVVCVSVLSLGTAKTIYMVYIRYIYRYI
jgi:uncharacterized membrane protein YobD (UPF0266 family)